MWWHLKRFELTNQRTQTVYRFSFLDSKICQFVNQAKKKKKETLKKRLTIILLIFGSFELCVRYLLRSRLDRQDKHDEIYEWKTSHKYFFLHIFSPSPIFAFFFISSVLDFIFFPLSSCSSFFAFFFILFLLLLLPKH